MSRSKISPATQRQVRTRANYLCEYCHTSEQWQYVPFTVDHVIPILQGGSDELDNMALACFHCNRQKSARLEATDLETNEEVPLFNPRQHRWAEHFTWSADKLHIIGLTPIGRATGTTLRFNRPRVIAIRAADLIVNRHPPQEDPVLSD